MDYLSQAVAQSGDAPPGWWMRQDDSICDFTRRQRCVVLAQITDDTVNWIKQRKNAVHLNKSGPKKGPNCQF
jgi:hypothetical protein